jgi:ankyrin repeat protein
MILLAAIATPGSPAFAASPGSSVHAPQELGTEGVTDLMRAAQAGNENKVKQLLAAGANPNETDSAGGTPLMWVSTWPQYDVIYGGIPWSGVIDRLLAAGASINARDNEGKTALIRAVAWDHPDIAVLFIMRGADVTIRDNLGRSALTYAYRGGINGKYLVKPLLRKGAMLSLIDALLFGETATARGFLATDNLQSRGPHNESMLMMAARMGDPKIVEDILFRGADANAQDDRGFTALLFALGGAPYTSQAGPRRWDGFGTSKGRAKIVATLLKYGVAVDPKVYDDESVLAWAIRLGLKDFVEVLLQNQALSECKRNQRVNPLEPAIDAGSYPMVKLLLEAGADPNATNHEYYSPFTLSVQTRNPNLNVIRLLLDKGGNVNEARFGSSPLMLAAGFSSEPVARLLLLRGARINFADKDGSTALMQAAAWNSRVMVKLLLEAGADAKLKKRYGAKE